jgi:hypothetical protein
MVYNCTVTAERKCKKAVKTIFRNLLFTVNVHNNRPLDSAHFAQPMSHDSTYTSLSLAHVCSDRPADSTRIVSYIGRQYARTVRNVDIVGICKRHTRHLATGGVTRRFRNFCFYRSIPFTGLVRVVRLLHSTRHSLDKIALRLIGFVDTAVQWTFFYPDDGFY